MEFGRRVRTHGYRVVSNSHSVVLEAHVGFEESQHISADDRVISTTVVVENASLEVRNELGRIKLRQGKTLDTYLLIGSKGSNHRCPAQTLDSGTVGSLRDDTLVEPGSAAS